MRDRVSKFQQERRVHEIVMWDRNKLLAHSASDAINMDIKIVNYGTGPMVAPVRSRGMDPLAEKATRILRSAIAKLESAVIEHRRRLEHEVRPYLPVVEPERLLD